MPLTTSTPRYSLYIHKRAYEVEKCPRDNYAIVHIKEEYNGHRCISYTWNTTSAIHYTTRRDTDILHDDYFIFFEDI